MDKRTKNYKHALCRLRKLKLRPDDMLYVRIPGKVTQKELSAWAEEFKDVFREVYGTAQQNLIMFSTDNGANVENIMTYIKRKHKWVYRNYSKKEIQDLVFDVLRMKLLLGKLRGEND